MQSLMIRLLVFLALTGSANAAQTTYNFNFSTGGTGSFIYDDVARTTSAITFDFGALGSIAPYSFGAELTATVFGTPPTAAIRQDGTFFGVTRVADTPTATVRLYTNGTFCVRPYPEPTPDSCLVSGTYRIAPPVVPPPPFILAEFAPDASRQFGISGFSSSFARTGQTFTASRDGRLDTIGVLLAANGDVPTAVAIEVRPVDPITGLAGSAVLASAAANTVSLSNTPTYYTASFSGSDIVLRGGATYAWTLRPTGTNTGATAYGDLSSTGDPYPGGAYQRSNDAGTTWIQQAGNYDLAFRVTAVTPVGASNDSVFGSGAVSTDLANRAEWLDLPLTQGHSPAEIIAGYGGYASGGFRFATTDEVAALWAAFGLTHVGSATADPLQVSSAQSILSVMGSTSTGAGFSALGGHTLHPSLAGQYTQSSIEVFTTVSWCSGFGLPAPCTRALVQNGSILPTEVTGWVGAMLVREIPTPDQAFFPFNFIGGDISVNGYQIGGNLAQQLAQTFTAASSGTLTSVEVHISGFGGGTQPINVALRATGPDGLPLDGTPLASATIPRANVPSMATFTRISFASPPEVTSGSRLAIVLSSGETVGSYGWTGSTSFAQFKPPFYAAGAGFFRNTNNPDWRESGTTDYGFRAYIQPGASPSDVTAPSLTLPPNITVAATGPSGAVVSFNISATDDIDGPVAAMCQPPSGSTFGLGSTAVSCSAADVAGNIAQGSFVITVEDQSAPAIGNVPGPITLEASGPAGALAAWTAPTATDLESGPVPVACSPSSGSLFPLGSTHVSCTATDGSGNTSVPVGFTVTIQDTTKPQIVLGVTADSWFPDPIAYVSARAVDAVRVTAVQVNGVNAAFSQGSATDGWWLAPVPNVPGQSAIFTASARDASGNTQSASVTIDNDGISSAIDKDRLTLADRSSVYSTNFVLGETKGTIMNGNVRIAASPLGSEVYLFATGGTSSAEYATANKLCAGSDKWVNLNAGDAARIKCIGSTLYVYGESGSTEVVRYDGASCYSSWSSSYCTYYYTRYIAYRGGWAWLGSPVTAADGNPEPIAVDLIRITTSSETPPEPGSAAFADAEVIGRFELDGGESVDVVLEPGELGSDRVRLGVIKGTVSAQFSGTTHVLTEGTQATLEPPSTLIPVDQTITFGPLPNKMYGDAPFTVSASSNAGLPVSFATVAGSACSVDGPRVTLTAAGLCQIAAVQSGAPGINPAQAMQSFYVFHSWSGVLQPVNANGTSIFKLGSTLPIKFILTQGSAGVSTLAARLSVTKTSNGVVGTELEAVSTAAGDNGNLFRFDAATGQYVFNWSTKGLAEGTWQLKVDMGDGAPNRTVLVSLKK
jgi:hypothetical protein